jgi:NAD(P)H-quinone oxidoreductase subunit I
LAYNVEGLSADMGYCIFCGLCVEACPRDALFLGYDYEKARYRRGELQLDKKGLALEGGKLRSGYARPNMEKALPEQTLLLKKSHPRK